MGLAGTGAVAIWHDIAPEGRTAFYDWHGNEHMPERVGIPGFRRGRRYVAIEADLEFFNLYEADTPAVLTGPDYLARLNDPTPWTVETVKHFRHVARSICRVAASLGPGQGGLAATLRYDVPADAEARHIEIITREVLPALLADKHVAGAHLLIADADASAVDTAERKARGEVNRIPRWILVVEGWGDEARFMDHCAACLTADRLGPVERPDAPGFYRLQATATSPG